MSRKEYTPKSIGRVDPTFAESTHYYRNINPDQRVGRRLLVAMTDTGEARAILPALEILNDKNKIGVLAREAAATEVDQSPYFARTPHFDPSDRLHYALDQSSIVLTGMASNPTLELLTHKAANEVKYYEDKRRMKMAAIEDYPGGYPDSMKEGFDRDPQTRPNRLMVMNEWAKEANLAALPWFDPDHVLVTGQPAFDYIATEDRQQVKNDVYQQAGIQKGDDLVVWMGQKGGTKEAFEIFIDGLSQVQGNFRLAIRRHPRDVVLMEEYEDMTGKLRSRVVRTDGIPTSQVGAAADRLVTIFSTEGLSSVMREIPTLHILTPEILALTESPNVVVPVLDASHVIKDVSEGRRIIAQLFSERANQDLQEKMAQWKPDGKAGERVAAALVDIARGLK